MEDIIKQFCLEKEKGLFLLDMPTGFGKTYNVLEFIANNYDLPEFKDKKFFLFYYLSRHSSFYSTLSRRIVCFVY